MQQHVKHEPSARKNSGTGRGNPGQSSRGGGSNPSRGKRGRGNARPHMSRTEQLAQLMERQSQLTQAVVRQARLLKVARADVRSTESRKLEETTAEILRVSAGLAAETAPGRYTTDFERRTLTDAQVVLERMISRQGLRTIGADVVKPTTEAVNVGPCRVRKNRTRHGPDPSKILERDPVELTALRGPLVRHYLKSVQRGYRGGPQQWLRSKYARGAMRPLYRKGLLPLSYNRPSIFDPRSPIHWAVSAHHQMDMKLDRGFRGESLCNFFDAKVLQAQKRAVARLPTKKWPRSRDGALLWPSYPTLCESWEATMRRKLLPSSCLEIEPAATYSRCTLRHIQDNPVFAKRFVRQRCFGVRASVSVPEKFLGYFKYRWGFLILHRPNYLSIGLVRWLLGQWKVSCRNMLLLWPGSLRSHLRNIPSRWTTESAYGSASLKRMFDDLPIPPSEPGRPVMNRLRPMKFVGPAHNHLENDHVGTPSHDTLCHMISQLHL
jgi:hypothetical protein